jgi:hypothetical protein
MSYIVFRNSFKKEVLQKEQLSDEKDNTQTKAIKPKDSIPSFTNKANWKPLGHPISKNKDIILKQFELYGIETAYSKSKQPFAGAGKWYTTYALDPYYDKATDNNLSLNPIFNVAIENTSNRDLLITKILYRISDIGEVSGGDYGVLFPKARYFHTLAWKKGDQEFPLVPPFKIGSKSFGSFLLELNNTDNNVGLCWLMKVHFITSDEEGSVSTDNFQLIMSGAKK